MREDQTHAEPVQAQPEELVTTDPAAETWRDRLDPVGCELIAEALRAGREVRFAVTGSSMIPALWPGDALLVEPVSPGNVKGGQIVVFIRDGRLFAHRLVGTDAAGGSAQLITQGDAVDHADPPLPVADLLGRVRAVIRSGATVPVSLNGASLPLRLTTYALRHSDFCRRAALKIHSLRRRFGGRVCRTGPQRNGTDRR
jgi:signal peptidase I